MQRQESFAEWPIPLSPEARGVLEDIFLNSAAMAYLIERAEYDALEEVEQRVQTKDVQASTRAARHQAPRQLRR